MSASTSCNKRGQRLLRQILNGNAPDPALARSLALDDCSDALFRTVVEGLADRFEPRLCNAYTELFSEVLAHVFPDLDASNLLQRYNRIRVARFCTADPEQIFVLSRVTLGADIAVTSVLLEAARARFPHARLIFVGSNKNAELFEDGKIEHVAAPYPRTGSLRDRLTASRALAESVDRPNSIVLDPDSRLTQLGLLPVCGEERYYFFESRCYGGSSNLALPEIAAQWCQQVLGIADAASSLPFHSVERTGISVSFGVGDNPSKRLGDEFESGLLRELPGQILIDRGIGGEEAERVDSAIARSGRQAETWTGSFAGFARRIARSRLYIGYDSAGQHAAAALGVPLVAIFAGQVSPRMFERWKPTGRGPIVIVNAEGLDPRKALDRTLEGVKTLLSAETFAGSNEIPE